MKIIKIALSIILMLSTSILSMEQNNDSNKQDDFQQASNAHQQEAKEKEAEYKQHKKTKNNAQKINTEKSKESKKQGSGKEEEVDPILIRSSEAQEELFAKSKQAIEDAHKQAQPIQSINNSSSDILEFEHPFQLVDPYFQRSWYNLDNVYHVTDDNLLKWSSFRNFDQYLPYILEFIRTQNKNYYYLRDLLFRRGLTLAKCSRMQTASRNKMIREILCHPNSDLSHKNLNDLNKLYFICCICRQDNTAAFSLLSLFSNAPLLCMLNKIQQKRRCAYDLWVNNFMKAFKAYLLDHQIIQGNIDAASTNNMDLLSMILMITRYSDKFLAQFTDNDMHKYYQTCRIITGNEAAPDGTTALMFAVGGGYLKLVEELLRCSANPLLQNEYGDNALSIITIQLQRKALTDEQRIVFQQIEQLLKNSLSKQAQTIDSAMFWLMHTRSKNLPGELALRVTHNIVDNPEELLHYLPQRTPTLSEQFIPLVRPVVLSIILWLLHDFSFIDKL